MSKAGALLIILAVVLASIIGFRMMKESYKILPINENQMTDMTKFDFQNWHEFTAPSGKFKVLFPTLPQHATENINDPETHDLRKYDMYVSEKDDGTTFMISLITFLGSSISAPDERETLLKEMMKDISAANPENKIIRSETGQYKGNPSLDFTLENSKITMEAKTFIVGDTLYVLTRIVNGKDPTRDEFLFFINSFELTHSQKNSEPAEKK